MQRKVYSMPLATSLSKICRERVRMQVHSRTAMLDHMIRLYA